MNIEINSIYNTKLYGQTVVISKESVDTAKIRFLDTGSERICNISNIKAGKTKDYFKKSIYGVGIVGKGKYSKNKNLKAYMTWFSMIKRCYNKNDIVSGALVCAEGQNFQIYAEWFYSAESNYHEGYQLDKDLLSKNGIKFYSPETSLFVPRWLNMILMERKINRSELPIGVCEQNGLFYGKVNVNGKQILTKSFSNIDLAEYGYLSIKSEHLINSMKRDDFPIRIREVFLLKISEMKHRMSKIY